MARRRGLRSSLSRPSASPRRARASRPTRTARRRHGLDVQVGGASSVSSPAAKAAVNRRISAHQMDADQHASDHRRPVQLSPGCPQAPGGCLRAVRSTRASAHRSRSAACARSMAAWVTSTTPRTDSQVACMPAAEAGSHQTARAAAPSGGRRRGQTGAAGDYVADDLDSGRREERAALCRRSNAVAAPLSSLAMRMRSTTAMPRRRTGPAAIERLA
jgi:hypothetical protein